MQNLLFPQDLRNTREKLEKQNKALEVEYTELKRKSVSIEAVSVDTQLSD